MLGESIGAERPSWRFVLGVLLVCAVAAFVGGGVLGTVVGVSDTDNAGVDVTPSPDELQPVDVVVVGASCRREPAVDWANNQVTYDPEFAADGDTQTGWQCRGDGAGQTLDIDLGGPTAVAELGLIPGYAKVDEHEGTEWYPLNRRLTEVRWHFDEGEPIVQELDPDPERRDLQILTLDEPRQTATLTLEIVSSELGDGDRSNVAISDLRVRTSPQ